MRKLLNWNGNVIAPVGAALCVVMAIINYTHGRGVARWAVAAAGLLMISGLTRLIESWIKQETKRARSYALRGRKSKSFETWYFVKIFRKPLLRSRVCAPHTLYAGES